ncbi:hypothetical protein E5288_WYG013104 [Bos mutus]|uniref:Uncharacterized protein n=1 Tax=Bos mutus TaxID=72004 RepID=A0A6B0RCA0_9CETA|nr:hypothetical protein [Bos mutus]
MRLRPRQEPDSAEVDELLLPNPFQHQKLLLTRECMKYILQKDTNFENTSFLALNLVPNHPNGREAKRVHLYSTLEINYEKFYKTVKVPVFTQKLQKSDKHDRRPAALLDEAWGEGLLSDASLDVHLAASLTLNPHRTQTYHL